MSACPKSNLQLVQACDNFPYGEDAAGAYYELILPHDDRPHGYMLADIVKKIPWTSDFDICDEKRIVQLRDSSNGTDTSAACDAAFSKVMNTIIDDDLFEVVQGQHSELFQVLSAKYPVRIDRFATSLFGIIWVPRCSPNVKSFPNMLDTTVAGGIRAGESLFETIIHEADEEASLPADLLRREVVSSGTLTYISTTGENDIGETGLVVPDVVYVYYIELKEDVVPKPKDYEVKEFYPMSIEEVKKSLAGSESKTNCAVVMIDFFIRHGIITADNDEDFVEICQRMHRRLPFSTFKERK